MCVSCCLEEAQRDPTTERFTSSGLVWKILKGMFYHSGNDSDMQRMENKTLYGWSPQLIYSRLSLSSDRPQFMVDFVDFCLKPPWPAKTEKTNNHQLFLLAHHGYFSFQRNALSCKVPKQYPMSNGGFKWAQYLWESGPFPSGWRTGPDVFV